jgi:predicted membrane-bound mannosyltransferase
MYPNTSLAAWQLAVMAVVAVAALAVWLTAVYLAARDTDGHNQAAAGSAPGAAAAGTGSRNPVPTGERRPERPPADQAAA